MIDGAILNNKKIELAMLTDEISKLDKESNKFSKARAILQKEMSKDKDSLANMQMLHERLLEYPEFRKGILIVAAVLAGALALIFGTVTVLCSALSPLVAFGASSLFGIMCSTMVASDLLKNRRKEYKKQSVRDLQKKISQTEERLKNNRRNVNKLKKKIAKIGRRCHPIYNKVSVLKQEINDITVKKNLGASYVGDSYTYKPAFDDIRIMILKR